MRGLARAFLLAIQRPGEALAIALLWPLIISLGLIAAWLVEGA